MRSRPCLGSKKAARSSARAMGQKERSPGATSRVAPAKPTAESALVSGAGTTDKTGLVGAAPPLARVTGRSVWHSAWRAIAGLVALAALWVALTGGVAESWVMGGPAVLLGTALIFLHEAAPRWRLSPIGASRFIAWFALQSMRGAVDVAARAFAWRLPLAPGCRTYRTALPEGAPLLLFANAITLLPGTLTAGIEGDRLVIHMLDTGADLDGELAALERRVAALFALSLPDEKLVEATP